MDFIDYSVIYVFRNLIFYLCDEKVGFEKVFMF